MKFFIQPTSLYFPTFFQIYFSRANKHCFVFHFGPGVDICFHYVFVYSPPILRCGLVGYPCVSRLSLNFHVVNSLFVRRVREVFFWLVEICAQFCLCTYSSCSFLGWVFLFDKFWLTSLDLLCGFHTFQYQYELSHSHQIDTRRLTKRRVEFRLKYSQRSKRAVNRQRWPQSNVTVGLLAFWHPQLATVPVENCRGWPAWAHPSEERTENKNLLRIFGPELIRINQWIKTARSAFLAASAGRFWKYAISSASERAFPVFFGDIFGCSTLFKKRCFSTEEFFRFLSMVSSQRRATRSDVSLQT